MEDDYELLSQTAKNIAERLQSILKDNDCAWDEALHTQYDTLCRRVAEVSSKAFVAIVVGPVKSGKSTFVNLLSHAYVSPTHFLECTIKPSVISPCKEGQPCEITLYETAILPPLSSASSDDTAQSLATKTEEIIDHIKGIDNTPLSGITLRAYPLTPENIDKYVKKAIDPDVATMSDDSVLTSITAPGGDFLSGDVFLIDMPGFDGLRANIKALTYQTLAERADLIIFIQSSNSAINKISGDFLALLKSNNGAAPVCLVHNCFDSAYWRKETSRKADAARQLQEAILIVRQNGFNLPEDCSTSLNLGKVADSQLLNAQSDIISPEYDETLRQAAEEFKQYETMLHDRILNSRHTIRLKACLTRIREAKDTFEKMLSQRLIDLGKTEIRYNNAKEKLLQLQTDDAIFDYNKNDFPLTITATDLIDTLGRYRSEWPTVNLDSKKKYNGESARHLVSEMQTSIKNSLKNYLLTHIPFSTAYQATFTSKEENRRLQITNTIAQLVGHNNIKPDLVFSPILYPEFDLDIIKTVYNPLTEISETHLVDRYDSDQVAHFLQEALKRVRGEAATPGTGKGFQCGCLADTFYPEMVHEVETTIRGLLHERKIAFLNWIEDKQNEILRQIIPDLVAFHKQKDALNALLSSLQQVNITV